MAYGKKNGWADRAEILHSLWGILRVTFDEKWNGPDQETELWRHKRCSLRPISQRDHVFGNLLTAIDLDGDIMRALGQKMATPNL